MAYIINVGTKGDTSGIDKVTGAFKKADDAADDFFNSIKAGVGIDIGGKIVNGIAAIPGMLQSAISKGMEFNAMMDNSEVGIANVLAKFMDLDEQAAKAEAAKAIQKIIELEPKAAGGLSDLVLGFMATVAAAQGVGMTVEENIDLVGRFANAIANSGQPIQQLGQEVRSVLTGNITADSAIAKTLGISNADIEQAKELGNVYEFLRDKIGKFGEAGDSAAVRLSSFESSVDKALGELTKPIFDAWTDSLVELTDAAGEAGGAGAMKTLGFQLAELVKTGASFSQMLSQHSGLILAVSKGVGALAAAWAAYQIAALVVGLNRKAAAVLSNKVAVDAETASLARNTAAQASNTAARRLTGTGGIMPRMTGGGGNVAGAAGVGLGLGLIGYDLLSGKAAQMNAESARTAEIGDQISNIANQYNAAIKAASSMADKENIIKGLEADIQKLREMSGGASEFDAEMIERSAQLLEMKLATARKLSDETLKQKEAATAQTDAEAKAAASLEENQKIIAAEIQRRHDAARDRTAREKLDAAKAMLDGGDIAGGKASLDEQQKYFQDWKASAEKKINPANPNKEELKDSYDLVAQIQGYLDEIAAARKELPKAIADADKKAKEEQIKTLEEQRDLSDAEGRKRLAELEAQGKKGADNAKARQAIEDEIARKRLDIENQIGQLQDESATARQIREISFEAERIARSNSAANAEAATNLATGRYDAGEGRISTGTGISSKYGVRGAKYDINGNLIGGTRGGVPMSPSDLATVNQNENPMGSGIDKWRNMQPGAPNYTPTVPGSTVPPIAAPGGGGGGPSAPSEPGGGDSGASGVADAAKNLTEEIKKMNEGIKSLLEEASGAAAEASGQLPALGNTVRQIKSDVKALQRANS